MIARADRPRFHPGQQVHRRSRHLPTGQVVATRRVVTGRGTAEWQYVIRWQKGHTLAIEREWSLISAPPSSRRPYTPPVNGQDDTRPLRPSDNRPL